MKKFMKSRWFVGFSTFITFALGMVMTYCLSFRQRVSGGVSLTKYVFDRQMAIGYFCLTLILTLIVFLLCVVIRKPAGLNITEKKED